MKHEREFPIIWRNELCIDDLNDVLSKKVAAIRIPKYYQPNLCAEISRRLISSQFYGRYVNAPNIGRVGQAFFESQASEKSKEAYKAKSIEWIREIREGCAPHLSPIDKLRLELDEVWPPGATLGDIGGAKMFAGLARHFDVGSEAEPHTDVLAWDALDEPNAKSVRGQLATNTYLTIPEKGGELTLWDVWPNREEYEKMRVVGSYGLKRDLLPEPIATIKPEVGELIIFHPQRVHAVEKIEAGSRVTWSCFLGHRSNDQPLIMWS